MDEHEFHRVLSLFPVVRARDFHVECVAGSSSQTTSHSGKIEENEHQDGFWGKLRLAAEKKVGEVEAEKFCDTFRTVYNKLVYEAITEEAAWKFLDP